MPKAEYLLDGRLFTTLEGFFQEIGRLLIPGSDWGRNLDAFNDILRGGFGTPESGFLLVWANSDASRQRLSYAETVRQLEARLKRCHPLNVPFVQKDLERAKRPDGPTVFDWLVEIILVHCEGGKEQDDGVELLLLDTLDPAWLTSTVVALANGIYHEKAFDRMPILADALQDTDCNNEDILNHCRQPGEHIRGCWVVDLLTGRD